MPSLHNSALVQQLLFLFQDPTVSQRNSPRRAGNTDGILLRVQDCAGGNPNLLRHAWKLRCSKSPCFSSTPQDTELCFWSMFFWSFRSRSKHNSEFSYRVNLLPRVILVARRKRSFLERGSLISPGCYTAPLTT